MDWIESNGELRAEGQYARQYRVYRDGERWRAESVNMKRRTFATEYDAKLYCEQVESECKRG